MKTADVRIKEVALPDEGQTSHIDGCKQMGTYNTILGITLDGNHLWRHRKVSKERFLLSGQVYRVAPVVGVLVLA